MDGVKEPIENKPAKNEDVLQYESLVTRIAASLYARRFDDSVSFEDYKHYGYVGLLEVYDKYDSSKGAAFETFATYRIRGAILNGIGKLTEKHHYYAYKSKANRERVQSLREKDAQAESKELFESFSEMTASIAISFLLDDLSVFDTENDVSCEAYISSQLETQLLSAVEFLPSNEKKVVVYHYFGSLSFREVADSLRLTKGRVSQLHKSAISKLKKYFSSDSYSDIF